MRCHYCGNPAELVTGEVIYPHRPDLYELKFWRCVPCEAYTGCHGITDKPKGRLANAKLRALRVQAHAAFDPLWQSGKMKRNDAYRWLAGHMNTTRKHTYIGWFGAERCKRVIEICKTEGDTHGT